MSQSALSKVFTPTLRPRPVTLSIRSSSFLVRQFSISPCSTFFSSSSILLSSATTTATTPPPSTLTFIEQAKQKAAAQAVHDHIHDTDRIIGIGSGSTMIHVINSLVQTRDPKLNSQSVFIPTSFQSRVLLINHGFRIGALDQYPVVDIAIDGADEVDSALNLIKGGGAAHLQEKLVAEAAKKFVIVADHRKDSEILGQQWHQGVPVEVSPLGWKSALKNLKVLGSENPQLRMAVKKAGPVVTDNGNFVLDAPFGLISDPARMMREIKLLTGVVEVGLFCNLAHVAYFGQTNGSVKTRTK